MKDAVKGTIKDTVKNTAEGAVKDTVEDTAKGAVKDTVKDTAEGAVKGTVRDAAKDMGEDTSLFHIVLVEPEIPPNTGNISRTCAITGTKLHLVKPLGFSIGDRELKRAGLDYWDHLDLEVHDNLDSFMEKYGNKKLYLATTHGGVRYTDVEYEAGSFILFGRETAGLPKDLIARYPDTAIRIPMGNHSDLRSLNLSNSAAVVLYEALRQHGFPGLV